MVIESKDPKWNCKFAKDVEGADVKAHEKVVIESKNLLWNYHFAKDVAGADIIAHGQVIIESKDSTYNCMFKEDFKEAFEDEYKIIKRNNLIDYTYNFLDDALDKMIKENNEENKSMQKRS